MNELSLFTGAGGGVLGTTLLGWKHRGYVEWDDYCQRVIRQRIIDGIIDEAPIFCDVRAFVSEGYAASYTGMVDVITAGFPCQPFSVAGKRKGVDDERNMWPATADVIRIVRPRFVLLENVPGIREYLPVVLRDMRRLGYTVRRPLQLGADNVGGKHRRKRIWIVAHTEHDGRIADGERNRLEFLESIGSEKSGTGDMQTKTSFDCSIGKGGEIPDSESEQITWKGPSRFQSESAQCYRCGRWPSEPDVGRVADGVASRVDRLKALGNGQVPRVVAAAWEILARN